MVSKYSPRADTREGGTPNDLARLRKYAPYPKDTKLWTMGQTGSGKFSAIFALVHVTIEVGTEGALQCHGHAIQLRARLPIYVVFRRNFTCVAPGSLLEHAAHASVFAAAEGGKD